MKRWLLPLALTAGMSPAVAPAQPPPPTDPPKAVVISLRPAAPPSPALKYRLVPERRELVPGNAAVFYHRAIEMVLQTRQRLQSAARVSEKAEPGSSAKAVPDSPEMIAAGWVSGPLADIPRDKAREYLQPYQNAFNEIELGVQRKACDWEFDLRREGIQLLIPEIQEMRALGRLVALRTRLAVLDGKTDEAVHWIATGYVMARHVSQGPILIQALVGCALASVTSKTLEDLIQAPGTPSLYWSLAVRPRPFIDLTPSLEGERAILETELPSLRELEGGPWTVEKARQFTDEMNRKFSELTGGFAIPATGAPAGRPPGLGSRMAMAAVVAKIYPEAKRALIARGRPAAEVEAMPAAQVAALHTLLAYYELRDDIYKWFGLPYWQAYKGLESSRMPPGGLKSDNPLLAVAMMLIPAYHSAILASVRVDRQLDALQCVEAVRLHAAAHGGALPASLGAITEAPVPGDPATGKPFGYKVEGDTATLSAPVPPGAPNHPFYMIRYELKPAR